MARPARSDRAPLAAVICRFCGELGPMWRRRSLADALAFLDIDEMWRAAEQAQP